MFGALLSWLGAGDGDDAGDEEGRRASRGGPSGADESSSVDSFNAHVVAFHEALGEGRLLEASSQLIELHEFLRGAAPLPSLAPQSLPKPDSATTTPLAEGTPPATSTAPGNSDQGGGSRVCSVCSRCVISVSLHARLCSGGLAALPPTAASSVADGASKAPSEAEVETAAAVARISPAPSPPALDPRIEIWTSLRVRVLRETNATLQRSLPRAGASSSTAAATAVPGHAGGGGKISSSATPSPPSDPASARVPHLDAAAYEYLRNLWWAAVYSHGDGSDAVGDSGGQSSPPALSPSAPLSSSQIIPELLAECVRLFAAVHSAYFLLSTGSLIVGRNWEARERRIARRALLGSTHLSSKQQTPHPYLEHHRWVVDGHRSRHHAREGSPGSPPIPSSPPVSAAAGAAGVRDSASAPLNSRPPVAQDERPSASGDDSDAAAGSSSDVRDEPAPPIREALSAREEEPQIEAIAQLLQASSDSMAEIMELEGIPHSMRSTVAAAVHEAVCPYIIEILTSYAADAMLGVTLFLARTMVEDAFARESSGSSRGRERTGGGAPDYLTSAVRSAMEAAASTRRLEDTRGLETGRPDDDAEGNAESDPDFARAEDGGAFSSSAVRSGGGGVSGSPAIWRNVLFLDLPSVSSEALRSRTSTARGGSTSEGARSPARVAKLSDACFLTILEPLAPLSLDLDLAVSLIDDAADQASYLSSVLGRYLECVNACTLPPPPLAGGPQLTSVPSSTATVGSVAVATSFSAPHVSKPAASGAPILSPATAAPSPSSRLLISRVRGILEELQDACVLLENAYLATSVRGAVTAVSGWVASCVHEDPSLETFAWCDHAFFLLSKATARAAATGSDMAAAATINYVHSCLDATLARVMRESVRLCGELRVDADALTARLGQSFLLAQSSSKDVSFASLMAHGRNLFRSDGAGTSGGGGGGGQRAPSADKERNVEADFAASFEAALFGGGSTRGGGSSGGTAAAGASAPSAASRLGGHAAVALQRGRQGPIVSREAILALNTLATVVEFSLSLLQRSASELAIVFPPLAQAPPSDASTASQVRAAPRASGGARSSSGAVASSSSSAQGAPASLISLVSNRLKAAAAAAAASTFQCATMLQPPLHELAAMPQTFEQLLSTGASEMARAMLAPGLSILNATIKTMRYELTSAEFDAISSADPVMAAIRGPVIQGCALFPTMLVILRPACTDLIIARVSVAILGALEAAWLGATVNDFGALLMVGQLRQLQNILSSHLTSGSLRLIFLRAQQIVQVLSIEAIPDLYALLFSTPALRRTEVVALLSNKSGLLPTDTPRRAAVLDAIQWPRVSVVVDPDS